MALYNITTQKEFEDKVLNNVKVVLVDFWAAWCPPCIAMAPALHDIGEHHDDVMDIVKVNIEESADNQMIANAYGVRSIPNMPLFFKGKEMERIVGLVPKSTVLDMAKKLQAK